MIGLLGIDPTMHQAKSLVGTLGKQAMEELTAVVYRFSYVMFKGEQVPATPTAFGKVYGFLARQRAALAGGNSTPFTVWQGYANEHQPSARTKQCFTERAPLD